MKMNESSRAVDKKLQGNNIPTGSSNKTDGGTLMRVMGRILEFLAENEDIFTIMTSNDVTQLPPELSRSGRIDTIWYFGLPNEKERKEIIKIHLNKVNNKIQIKEDILTYLISKTNEMTGAEIQQLIKVIFRKAFIRYKKDGIYDILVEDIDNSLGDIIPVYKYSKEKMLALEKYAETRAKFASKQKTDKKNKNKNTFISISDMN